MRLDKLNYMTEEKFLDAVSSALYESILNADGLNVTLLGCAVCYDQHRMQTVYGIHYKNEENRRKTVTVCAT